MEAYLQHLVTQSVAYSLIAVFLVAFLESLALVGLLLPGTVMMATLGALIGSGQVNFYYAWGVGILACFAGDWISYFIGRAFKDPLHRWSFIKKNKALLDRTEHALHRHSMITVLIGRFVGPTRPVVPMVAGMLALPPRKFIPPNIIGCITWPPVYFFPGILAGVAIDIPAGSGSTLFKVLLALVVVSIWIAGWLSWRWWREGKRSADKLSQWLTPLRLRIATVVMWGLAAVSFVFMHNHPLMPIYRSLLWKVVQF